MMPNTSNSELLSALLAAAPALDARERQLAVNVYRSLAKGHPVLESTLAHRTGLPVEYVGATLASWPGVFRDEQARVIGFWGLALPEMPHALEVNGVRLHAWCAWDTLFLPGILEATARVRSLDPQSQETVALVVAPDGITDCSHTEITVSFLVPNGTWDQDVMTTFCHYIHFFADPMHGKQWTSTRDGTFLLDLDEAFDIGFRWNRGRGLA